VKKLAPDFGAHCGGSFVVDHFAEMVEASRSCWVIQSNFLTWSICKISRLDRRIVGT
jgi:hypothetical protein